MRIKIGDYIRYSTMRLEQKYIKFKYKKSTWEVEEYSHIDEVIISVLTVIENLDITVIDWIFTLFGKQRSLDRKVSIKISKSDTYSMCNTVSIIMIPLLQQFKKDLDDGVGGYPCSINANDYPTTLEPYDGWLWIIDQMVEGFRITDDECSAADRKIIYNGRMLFAKYYDNLWW